ncbi:MAG TPA: 50S ribosomal protein L13 [Patescibacteria group bacterium]
MKNAQITTPTKANDIKRSWHLIDAKGMVLGRVSVEIAKLLMGKSKPYFVKNLDCGDYVVVINAKGVKLTGTKATTKTYYRHSGYPGGFKGERFDEIMNRKPEDAIIHSVKGMIPQNKLRASMLKRLYVFAGETHTYQDKLNK